MIGSISVIVPVRDEAEILGAALAALAAAAAKSPFPVESIVADGSSRDASARIAAACGARVITCPPGRGRQMNRAAAIARGDALLFLHADARLPVEPFAAIADALADPGCAGGGFAKAYEPTTPALDRLARLQDRLRGRAGQLVGSQGIFVRRTLFERLGGYREWPLLEDVELCDRLRRLGRLRLLAGPIQVSSRRYLRRGVLRQTAANLAVLGLYRIGLRPAWLHRLYTGMR